jgi:organic radical activating enzyme
MNCKLCSFAVPYLQSHFHYDKDIMCEDLRRALSLCDSVKHVDLMGGEPLLHPDIAEIIERLQYIGTNSKKFGEIRILTNGSISPDDKLLKAIRALMDSGVDFLFFLDNYGKISTKMDDIKNKLTIAQIPYREVIYFGEEQFSNGWVDYRFDEVIPTRKSQTDHEIQQVYDECFFSAANMWELNNGKLFPCTYTVTSDALERKCLERGDYLDLRDDTLSVSEKKEMLYDWATRKEHYSACQYCGGIRKSSPRYMAGEQIQGGGA